MRNKKIKSWRDDRYMWVLGCIDSQGAIVANPSEAGRTHSREESRGKRWRWCVWSQEFTDTMGGLGEITEEEIFTIKAWLIRHGYAADCR